MLKFEFVLNETYPGYLEFQNAGFTVIWIFKSVATSSNTGFKNAGVWLNSHTCWYAEINVLKMKLPTSMSDVRIYGYDKK